MNLYKEYKNLIERRRVIKRNAPQGFYISLICHIALVIGVFIGIAAFIVGVPYINAFFMFLLISLILNTIWYTFLWFEMIASVRRNEPEKLDLVLKYE